MSAEAEALIARMTATSIADMFKEIETGRDRLHNIEWEIAENLQLRPIRTWCPACFRIYAQIHAKAMAKENPCSPD